MAITGFLGSTAFGADLSQAVIKEKYNVVTLAPNQTGAAHPAPEGTVIHDEGVVRTGTDSRAGIEFGFQDEAAWIGV